MKKIITLLLCLTTVMVFSQDTKPKKTETITIKTSAECDMCKERIEQGLSFEKGVKLAVLDVPTKVLTVEYNPTKTTVEALRMTVSKLGYDADSVRAEKSAYDKLPACCKKGGMD